MEKNNLWCNDRVRYKEDMHELDLIPKLQQEVRTLSESLKIQVQKVDLLTAQKDGAYSERNKLVCALSKFFPSSLERHPDEDKCWEDDWRWIVMINLPTGQACWHIHDSEVSMFDHLPKAQQRFTWDGHTTEEKYERVARLPDLGAYSDIWEIDKHGEKGMSALPADASQ